jgi:beta-N-acetylhexosaminidase
VTSAAVILGCAGPELTDEERDFFRRVRPWGFILFARNIRTAEQTRALTDALREAAGDAEALVFVDQEGGRVQRLRPPLAQARRPAEPFGQLYERDPDAALEAVRLNHRLLADEIRALGFDADCAPSLDLRFPGASDIIGDRSFGPEPSTVSALGRAAMDGLTAGGIAPVIKHMPGHGRAAVDSHHELPGVTAPLEELEQSDFEPFRALADAPMGMTAHVVFTEIDAEAPVTISRHAVSTVIRGHIGFDGLLMTDDLSMKALGGSMRDRSDAAIRAGCDVLLHCNDDMTEMVEVAAASPRLAGRSAERAETARAAARHVQDFDADAATAHLARLGLGGRMSA